MTFPATLLASAPGVYYAFENSDALGKGIVVLLLIGSVFTWTVMIDKAMALYRAKKYSDRFLQRFRANKHNMTNSTLVREAMMDSSPVAQVYSKGVAKLIEFYEADASNTMLSGGTVVVLGRTGRNFASGMSGGVAYVFDADGDFEPHCNTSMVVLERVVGRAEQKRMSDARTWHMGQTDEDLLKGLIERHARYTGSTLASELLAHWPSSRARFVKVMPLQYRDALSAKAA